MRHTTFAYLFRLRFILYVVLYGHTLRCAASRHTARSFLPFTSRCISYVTTHCLSHTYCHADFACLPISLILDFRVRSGLRSLHAPSVPRLVYFRCLRCRFYYPGCLHTLPFCPAWCYLPRSAFITFTTPLPHALPVYALRIADSFYGLISPVTHFVLFAVLGAVPSTTPHYSGAVPHTFTLYLLCLRCLHRHSFSFIGDFWVPLLTAFFGPTSRPCYRVAVPTTVTTPRCRCTYTTVPARYLLACTLLLPAFHSLFSPSLPAACLPFRFYTCLTPRCGWVLPSSRVGMPYYHLCGTFYCGYLHRTLPHAISRYLRSVYGSAFSYLPILHRCSDLPLIPAGTFFSLDLMHWWEFYATPRSVVPDRVVGASPFCLTLSLDTFIARHLYHLFCRSYAFFTFTSCVLDRTLPVRLLSPTRDLPASLYDLHLAAYLGYVVRRNFILGFTPFYTTDTFVYIPLVYILRHCHHYLSCYVATPALHPPSFCRCHEFCRFAFLTPATHSGCDSRIVYTTLPHSRFPRFLHFDLSSFSFSPHFDCRTTQILPLLQFSGCLRCTPHHLLRVLHVISLQFPLPLEFTYR